MERDGFVHTARRRHALRRFSKAAAHAVALAAAAAGAADDRAAAEAAAYADEMRATELFEKARCALRCVFHVARAWGC
jgi:RNA-binding signal recognition particle 68